MITVQQLPQVLTIALIPTFQVQLTLQQQHPNNILLESKQQHEPHETEGRTTMSTTPKNIEIVLFDHDETLTIHHTWNGFDGECHGFGVLEEELLDTDDKIAAYIKKCQERGDRYIPSAAQLKAMAVKPEELKKRFEQNGKHPIFIKHIINKLQKLGKSVGIVSFHDGCDAESNKDGLAGQ